MPRQTADVVALILAGVVAIVVVATALVVLYIEITQPAQNHIGATDAIGRIVGVLIAALVGYMAGRGVKANGS